MPAPENPLRTALAANRMQLGAWVGLRSPEAAEIAALAGFDWCLLDGEHGPWDVPAIRDQILAVRAAGAHPVVRVPEARAWMIKQVLDLGAQSVLVPMVNSGEEAAAMARAMRYPPQGVRGMAAPVVRASGFGAIPDYAATANAQICLLVQAETRAALENIDAIAATEGVDGVFIGPADLSADMGFEGELGAPELDEAIEHMIARIRAAGKAAGILALDEARMARYAQLGVRFMGVASDIVALSGAMRSTAARFRALLDEEKT